MLFLKLPTLLVVSVLRHVRRKPEPARQSILILRLDGIGDCVMALPFYQQLRELFPNAHITVVAAPASKPLLETLSSVDEVLVLQPLLPLFFHHYLRQLAGALFLYKSELSHRRFQKVISMRWDVDTHFTALLAGLVRAPESVGYEDGTSPAKRMMNSGFQKVWTRILPAGPIQHEVLHNAAVAEALGWRGNPGAPTITSSVAERKTAVRWIGPEQGAKIALGLPASEATRRWSTSRYIQMLHEISAHVPVVPVLFADGATLESAREIAAAFPAAKIACRLPLSEAAAILSESAVFVGSDSGLGHIAAAVGCPTVTISPHPMNVDLGHANSPARFRPFGERCVFLQPHKARPGCESGCTGRLAHCILDISALEVANVIMQFLTASHDAPSRKDQEEVSEVQLATKFGKSE